MSTGLTGASNGAKSTGVRTVTSGTRRPMEFAKITPVRRKTERAHARSVTVTHFARNLATTRGVGVQASPSGSAHEGARRRVVGRGATAKEMSNVVLDFRAP